MKNLHLSDKESIFCGVCGGIAESTGLDPVIIRLLFVGGMMLNGMTFVLYILLWIIMPEEDND
jgi:phage shock protein PspC (stress-responsive transcriptional regulator)